MRRTMIVTTLAAGAGLTALSGAAAAQSVEFYVGPSYGYGPYSDYDYRPNGYYYGPRTYGYTSRSYMARPERFRYGTKRWWRQMDRTGRGGHQK